MQLPEKIRTLIPEETYRLDETGMSGSSVLLFRDRVLKIQKRSRESENERRMMAWLQDRLPVPRMLAWEEKGDTIYLMMSRLPGDMVCGEAYREDPAGQARLMAEGLKRLWNVDLSGCPGDWRLEHKLAQAGEAVRNGRVNLDNVQPDTFGEGGFKDPAALLQWLWDNRPREELVLSHGDYCCPNVFQHEGRLCGYIDLGRTGIADKWCDIALCYRDLSNDFGGLYYGGRAHEGYDDMLLFRELCLEPDWEKIRYYILLDELF